MRLPQVRYANADGVNVAYEILGGGPVNLVRIPVSFGGILASVFDPALATQLDRLSSFSRLICFDRRGSGLSDPLTSGVVPPLEQQVEDLVAVLDATDTRRAALFGTADGGLVAMLFAAMYPDRVSSIVLAAAWARLYQDEDYPFGFPLALRDTLVQKTRDEWGNVDNPWGFEVVAPNERELPGLRERLALVQQVSASRATAAALVHDMDSDVRRVLPLIQAPILVTYPADDRILGLRFHARFLVDNIPNARLASYPGSDTYVGVNGSEMANLIEEFITGTRPAPLHDRILATVLFTDIVGSTQQAASLGDQAWHALLDRHDEAVRSQLARFHGREINTGGDSFFATFDGPARAIRCAQAIIDAASALGIEVRAGVHVGECQVRGADLAGIAVHTGARVAALADAGQVLATRTVKDLVAGSGISFRDHGTHKLKGVPDPWQIYEVSAT